tara:strand:+ start:2191 stop:3126 length:936 start_codon:yes stop_codon:yes gene_type:complete
MGGKKRRAIAKEAKDAANLSLRDAESRREVAQAGVDKQRAAYESFEFTNPYANMQNQFAGMENTYEDLTVNQQQAQFQAQQGQQQRANIMQQMQGAAGGSGIAALAQTLANQGQLQTQQISASIGQQEAMNQKLRAQGAAQIQQQERAGAAAVDLQQRQGEAMVQQAESGRISTLLGMEYGALTGAEAAVQQGFANQQSAIGMDAQMFAANQQMKGQIIGSAIGAAGSVVSSMMKPPMPPGSDRRLKKNINKIGESHSGLNIYSFEYKNPKHGEGLFQGVMSDEIPQEAVGKRDGYDTVDYSMLDVEFKQI